MPSDVSPCAWVTFFQWFFHFWKQLSFSVLGISKSYCVMLSVIVSIFCNSSPFKVFLIQGRVMMFFKIFPSACAHLSKSEATSRWCSFCCAVGSCGADFAHTYLLPKSLAKIACHNSKEIPSLPAIFLIVFAQISTSHISVVALSFLLYERCAECLSFSMGIANL